MSKFVCAGGEMADTLALGTSAARHGGSSPLPRTNQSQSCGHNLALSFSRGSQTLFPHFGLT